MVIDTNIAVSALIAKQGFSAKLFEQIISDKVQNFTSKEIIEEIKDVLNRKEITERASEKAREFILTEYLKHSVKVNPKTKFEIAKDPDDNKFIETAIEAKTGFIITGDKIFLELKEFKGIKIITAKEFLSLKR